MTDQSFVQACAVLTEAGFPVPALDDDEQPSVQAALEDSLRESAPSPPGFWRWIFSWIWPFKATPPPPAPSSPAPVAVDRAARAEQDLGFDAAVAAAREREIAAEEQRLLDAAIAADRDAEFEALGPEPPDGVRIGACLPSGRKIFRRFRDSAPARDIAVWVRHDQEIAGNGSPIPFELGIATARVNVEKTLADQGIVRSTLMTVIAAD
jgi:hypothetical protein